MFFPNQWDGFNRFKGLPKFLMPTPTPLNQVRSQRRTDGFGSGNRCLCLPLSLGPADPVASQQVVSHPGGRVEISGRAWLLRPYSWTFTRCASLAVRGVNYSLAPPKFSHLYLLLTCASNYSLAPPLLLTCASTTFPLAPPLKSNSLLKLSPLLLSTMPWSKI